jgi:muramidase (phage lysozyme)
MKRQALTNALADRNLSALLRVIRFGESHISNDEAYRALFGWRPGNGKVFKSFADHPRIRTYEKNDEFIRNGKKDYTTAAGAYQITETTWGDIVKALGPMDFSPPNQDLAAVYLIARRGALKDAVEGRFSAAILRLRKEWASLPGSGYGQPEKTFAQALAIYTAHGGRINEEVRNA